jgi:hypothetical protein
MEGITVSSKTNAADRGRLEHFRDPDLVAAVHFDLRVRAQAENPTYVKSRDLAERHDCTSKQAAMALSFVTEDDNGLDVSQWSSPSKYPKVWEVYRAE